MLKRPTETEIETIEVEVMNRLYEYLQKTKRKHPEIEMNLLLQIIPQLSRGLAWVIIPQSDQERWKFIEDNKDKIKELQEWSCFKINNANTNAEKRANPAYIVEAEREYLAKVFDNVLPKHLWTKQMKENWKEVHDASLYRFGKYLDWLTINPNTPRSPIVCIYNQNLRDKVTVRNNDIMAFSISLSEMVWIAYRKKFLIVLKGVGGKYEGMAFPPIDLMRKGMEEFKEYFLESLPYTPGANAVQIQLTQFIPEKAVAK